LNPRDPSPTIPTVVRALGLARRESADITVGPNNDPAAAACKNWRRFHVWFLRFIIGFLRSGTVIRVSLTRFLRMIRR
jgi:hypothetical protein